MSLTQERLKELLHYDPETGIFTWLQDRRGGAKAGDVAGFSSQGYVAIVVDMRQIMAHRLAWLYVHGRWPYEFIDHINGVRSDNRLCNIRECSPAENSRNCKSRESASGIRGVHRTNGNGKWRGSVKVKGKTHTTGTFEKKEDAEAAVIELREKLHGEFANHG